MVAENVQDEYDDVEEEEYDDDAEGEGEDDDDYDAEMEAHAEQLARQMQDQLRAEIGKVYGLQQPPPENPIIAAIRTVLQHAENDPRVFAVLSATLVAGSSNVHAILVNTLSAGQVEPSIVQALSGVLLSLADGDALNEVEVGPVTGKRKRDDDQGYRPPPSQRSEADIGPRVRHACETLTHALDPHRHPSLDQSTISRLQPDLHTLSLFASTSALKTTGNIATRLYEITGMIHLLGRQRGVQIMALSANNSTLDIDAAVYPCPTPSCPKSFFRLSSLQSHESAHHADPRPHTCQLCTARFGRETDLKRHIANHGVPQYQCDGCRKHFSRRDALRRHQTSSKAGPSCSDAVVNIIDQPGASGAVEDEPGELDSEMLDEARDTVLRLHGRLAERVMEMVSDRNGKIREPTVKDKDTGRQVLSALVHRSVKFPQGPRSSPSKTSLTVYGLDAKQTQELERTLADVFSRARALAEEEAQIEEEAARGLHLKQEDT